MRFSTRLCLALVAGALTGASARAALQATLPDASGGRPWEMIAVEFPAVSGDVDVSVQDVRGGVEIVRRVPGISGRTWLPLPVVAPSDLAASGTGAWPLNITLRSTQRGVEQARLSLAFGQGTTALRLASSSPMPGFGGLCVIVPEQEILAAPPLVFAGCDLVYLGPDLQARITRERALELLAAGVRLAAPVDGSGPPGSTGGSLGRLVWERTDIGGRPLWTTAARAAGPPAIIEPGLGHFTDGLQVLPPALTTPLLLTAPLAVILLVLQRGLFHRRRMVLAASVLSMVLLTGAMILYLHAHALRWQTLAQWRQTAASQDKPTGGYMLDERLDRCTAWFSVTADIKAEARQLLFPVAPTVGQYWALRDLQLRLDGDGHLSATLPARSVLWCESRAADALGVLPAYPTRAAERARLWAALQVAPSNAWWLIGGYVKAAETPDEPGTLLSAWAAGNPWVTGAVLNSAVRAMPWYEMRFEPRHRYLLWPREGILNVVDFGPPEDASATAVP
jgi:hypothetical protein